MSERRNFRDEIRKNRRTILAIMLLPVVGMVVAIPLIFVRAPQSFAVSSALILVMLFQYLIVVFYIMRRMDRMTSS